MSAIGSSLVATSVTTHDTLNSLAVALQEFRGMRSTGLVWSHVNITRGGPPRCPIKEKEHDRTQTGLL
ncbi:hypothetical protein EYF80_028695 [Liparis tanakae]|uniref:Uncharacterized protein n=1 Tax=Liparis tanakae TaxID=230148 RepID=A0A4Z2H8F3_9TELE|nr:hypothetical protein EYF80_028695 [Liparis tanakae]